MLPMITNMGIMTLVMILLSGCSSIITLQESLPGKHNTVRVIRHRGYYKDHIYARHPHVGRFNLPWLEKPQGTKKAGLRRVRRH